MLSLFNLHADNTACFYSQQPFAFIALDFYLVPVCGAEQLIAPAPDQFQFRNFQRFFSFTDIHSNLALNHFCCLPLAYPGGLHLHKSDSLYVKDFLYLFSIIFRAISPIPVTVQTGNGYIVTLSPISLAVLLIFDRILFRTFFMYDTADPVFRQLVFQSEFRVIGPVEFSPDPGVPDMQKLPVQLGNVKFQPSVGFDNLKGTFDPNELNKLGNGFMQARYIQFIQSFLNLIIHIYLHNKILRFNPQNPLVNCFRKIIW
jgi:hypothetical protein